MSGSVPEVCAGAIVRDTTLQWIATLVGTPAAILAMSNVPSAVITSYKAVKDAIERSRRWTVDGILAEAERRNPLQVQLYLRSITTISRNEIQYALSKGFTEDQIVAMVLASREAFEVCQAMVKKALERKYAQASMYFSVVGFNCKVNVALRSIANYMVMKDGILQLSSSKGLDFTQLEDCQPCELSITKESETYVDEDNGILVIYSPSPGTVSTISIREDVIDTRTTRKGENMSVALEVFFDFMDRTKDTGADLLQRSAVFVQFFAFSDPGDKMAKQAIIAFQTYADLRATIEHEIEQAKIAGALNMYYDKRERRLLHAETKNGPVHKRNAIHDFQWVQRKSEKRFADYSQMAQDGMSHLAKLGAMLEEDALSSDVNSSLTKEEATKEFNLQQLILLRRTSGQVAMEDVSAGASSKHYYKLQSTDMAAVLAQAQRRLFCYPFGDIEGIVVEEDLQLTVTPQRHALSTLGLFVSNAADDMKDGEWKEEWVDAVDKMILAVKQGFGEVERVTRSLLRSMENFLTGGCVSDIERSSRWIANRYGCSWQWLVRENVALRVYLGVCAVPRPAIHNKSSFSAIHEFAFGKTRNDDIAGLEFDVGVPLEGCMARPGNDGSVLLDVRDHGRVAVGVNDMMTAYDRESALRELETKVTMKLQIVTHERRMVTGVPIGKVTAE